MNEIKVNLSFTLPGSILLSEQECSRNSKKKKQDCYDHFSMEVMDKQGLKKVRKNLKVAVRKSRTAKQNIKITNEAYEAMLSTPTSEKLAKPVKILKGGVVKRVWDTLSIQEKLKSHFDLIAHDLKALSYSYEILDD